MFGAHAALIREVGLRSVTASCGSVSGTPCLSSREAASGSVSKPVTLAGKFGDLQILDPCQQQFDREIRPVARSPLR